MPNLKEHLDKHIKHFNQSTYATKLHHFFKETSWYGLSKKTWTIILCIVLSCISMLIVYTSKHPKKIESREMEDDTTEDKIHRGFGTGISAITGIIIILFTCLYILSHTSNKQLGQNTALIFMFGLKIVLLLFMWVTFYWIPIINYQKYGWRPFIDDPPKDSDEYKGYFATRGIMNVILIFIFIYCTYKISKNDTVSLLNGDNFIIAYIAVFMAGFGAFMNIMNMAGMASTDDVLLST